MPVLVRTIDYYTCQFKCGHKAVPKYKMETHEEKCFCNPEMKSCRICKNCKIDGHYMICEKLELQINQYEKVKKVYNYNMDIVWEVKENNSFDFVERDKVFEHNQSRPFPRKHCEHFELGKKVY
jgi:hypothetical protein